MISEKLVKMLETQITHEFTASHQYLAMSIYFAAENLDGFAAFFRRQSDEERGHALKIVDFLNEVSATYQLEALPKVNVKFKSPLEVAKTSLAYEQKVTASFNNMAATATAEKDFTTLNFLGWFLEEQIEEEATFTKLIGLLESDINLFQAEKLLPEVEE